MPKPRKWDRKGLEEAVKKSYSFAQVIKSLGLVPAGGNYKLVKELIAEQKLDISHFKGQGWAKGKSNPRNLEKPDIGLYFENILPIQSQRLKQRLIDDKFFEHKCSNCGLETWLDEPIPLELDHINGDNKDNDFNNLRLLCPNCHALTDTYRGRNKSSRSAPLDS